MRLIKSPLQYYGRKYSLAPFLLSFVPPHQTSIEPFCGSAAFSLAKERAEREIITDLDGELINFHQMVRDKWHLLAPLCANDYGREYFAHARIAVNDKSDKLEAARRFYSYNRQAFRNIPHTSTWDPTKETTFRNGLRWMEPAGKRLAGVEIHQMHYRDALLLYGNDPGAFCYLDPPYLFPERPGSMQQRYRATGVYRHDMGESEKHIELLRLIKIIKGKVMISGYPSDLYDDELKGWNKASKEVNSVHAVKSYRRRRTEVIWMNY